jgi:hypothetical protein
MAAGGRAQRRAQLLRWGYVIAAVLGLLTLFFLIDGSWILAIIFGVATGSAVWYVKQVRSVR